MSVEWMRKVSFLKTVWFFPCNFGRQGVSYFCYFLSCHFQHPLRNAAWGPETLHHRVWPRGGAAALPQVQPAGSSSPGVGEGPRGGALAGQPETSQRGAGSLQRRSLGQVHCLSGSVHCPVGPPGSASEAPGALAAWCRGLRAAQHSIRGKWLTFGQVAFLIPSPAVMRPGCTAPHPHPTPVWLCVLLLSYDSFRGVRGQAVADFTAVSVHPTPVLLPGKSHGWRRLVGCSPWGR